MELTEQFTKSQLTRGLPFVGVFPYIRKNPIEFFTQLSKLGTTVPFQLGPYKSYMLNRPEDVEHVLSKNNRNYEKSPFLKNLKHVLGEGLLTTDGPEWANDRRIVTATFTKGHFEKYARVVLDQTEDLIQDWRTKGRTFPVRIDTSFTRLTFRIISQILFSVNNQSHVDVIEEAVRPLLEFSLNRNLSLVKPPLWMPPPQNRIFHKNYGKLKRVAEELVQTHIDQPDRYHDLLSSMLKELSESKTQWSMDRIRDHLVTFMVAGHETSTMALVWTFYALATNPGIQDLAREEALASGKASELGFKDLERFPYIKRCVEEAMRLYPPAWKLDRFALGEDQLTDVKIQKDAFVLMFPYFIQKNPQYFENPLVYNPDNFLEKNVEARPKMSYFPFGGGPRVCIGRNLSVMEIVFILVKILQNYSFTLLPEPVVKPVALITIRPELGMNLEFQAIKP